MPRKYNHEIFIQKMYEIYGDEYLIKEKYINATTKILIQHSCGYEWRTQPYTILNGSSHCPKCSKLSRTKTHEDFCREVYSKRGEEYEVLEQYINATTKILMRHNKCGYEWKVQPGSFLNNNVNCPKCSKSVIKNTEYFKNEIYEIVGDEYTVLGEYEHAQINILMRHNKCGYEYGVQPNAFLHGNRCPYCNMSIGEKKVTDILNKYKIPYKIQYMMDDCRNIHKLRFDFAVLDKYENVLMFIEFQGKQHYEIIPFLNDEEGLKLRQFNDKLKIDYCKSKNIPLIEIPYDKEKQIEKIIIKSIIDILTKNI